MKQSLKKTSALLCAIILLFGITACSKEPAESTSKDETSSTASTESTTGIDDEDVIKPIETSGSSSDSTTVTATNNATQKPGDNRTTAVSSNTSSAKQIGLFGDLKGKTVRVVVGPSQNEWEKKFYKDFKEKYKLKSLDLVVYSYAEQQTKLPMLVVSGDTKNYLDVCTTGPTTLLRYVYGNVLMPIDKYVDKKDAGWNYPGTDPKNPQSMLDLYTVDGHMYGSPSYGYPETFIFYNKTYFNEKRIKDPYTEYYLKNNWNFETFKTLARDATTFAKDGKTVQTYGFATWNYFAFLQAAGNSAIVPTGKGRWKATVDQPSGLAALQLLYECSMNNWFTQNISGYNEFVERKTAMLIERPANAMAGNDCYNRMSDEIGMIPMPKWRNSDKYYAPTTADGMGVPTCSKNPAGAVAFIYEYNQAFKVRDSSTSGVNYQIRKKIISDEHLKIRNEYLKKATINVSLIDGLAGWYAESRDEFFKIIFVDKTKPANALEKMLPLINNSLKKTVG